MFSGAGPTARAATAGASPPPARSGSDSLDAGIRRLLEADSLNLDSLEILLHRDTLSGAEPDSAPPRIPGPRVAADRAGATHPVRPPVRDSVRLRWETGASSDVIDEQFFEYRDEVFDTLSRIRVNEPETRYAGVAALALDGTRSGGRVRWQLHDETSIGDLLQRSTLDLAWRDERSPLWKLALLPWLDVRHDRTFGRELDEWHGSVAAQLRRMLGDDADLELGVRGEGLRVSGSGTDFLLDRNAATVSAAFDRAPLLGDEAHAGYSFSVRQFPDSSERDHLEHGWQAQWRRLLPGAGWIGLDTGGERRSTLNQVRSTRDNLWRGRAGVELEIGRLAGPWIRSRIEGELLRYDAPDSEVYGDEQRLRVLLLPGLRPGAGRSVALGPRVERLRSPQQPAEDYTEVAGVAELEWATRGSFWSATPAVGRRTYSEPLGRALALGGLHTSYDFAELDLVGDQGLPGSLRLRALIDGRLERHRDPADDTRSLYFSVDLRMLF